MKEEKKTIMEVQRLCEKIHVWADWTQGNTGKTIVQSAKQGRRGQARTHFRDASESLALKERDKGEGAKEGNGRANRNIYRD